MSFSEDGEKKGMQNIFFFLFIRWISALILNIDIVRQVMPSSPVCSLDQLFCFGLPVFVNYSIVMNRVYVLPRDFLGPSRINLHLLTFNNIYIIQ